jgi:hypothetical protein
VPTRSSAASATSTIRRHIDGSSRGHPSPVFTGSHSIEGTGHRGRNRTERGTFGRDHPLDRSDDATSRALETEASLALSTVIPYVWVVALRSEVVRAVRQLAPDGDWVPLDEVATYLNIEISEAVIALDAAVSAGDLGSTWWDPVEVDGLPVGAPIMRYRIRNV